MVKKTTAARIALAALLFVGVQAATMTASVSFAQEPNGFAPTPNSNWVSNSSGKKVDGTPAVCAQNPSTGNAAVAVLFEPLPHTDRDTAGIRCHLTRQGTVSNQISNCRWRVRTTQLQHNCDTVPTSEYQEVVSPNFPVTGAQLDDAETCEYQFDNSGSSGAFLVDALTREVTISLVTTLVSSIPNSGDTTSEGSTVTLLGDYFDTSGRLSYECGFGDPSTSYTWTPATIVDEGRVTCTVVPGLFSQFNVTLRETESGAQLDDSGYTISLNLRPGAGDDDDRSSAPLLPLWQIAGLAVIGLVIIAGVIWFNNKEVEITYGDSVSMGTSVNTKTSSGLFSDSVFQSTQMSGASQGTAYSEGMSTKRSSMDDDSFFDTRKSGVSTATGVSGITLDGPSVGGGAQRRRSRSKGGKSRGGSRNGSRKRSGSGNGRKRSRSRSADRNLRRRSPRR